MTKTALVLCGEPRMARFLVTELGCLGVSATDTPSALLAGDEIAPLAALTEAIKPHLLVADRDTCSDAVRLWLTASAPCPILTFSRRGKSFAPAVRAEISSLSLHRPFSIAEFDGAVRALLSLDGGEGVCPLPLVPVDVGGTQERRGAIAMTLDDKVATVQGHNVPLTATESAILAHLLSHRGELVPRDALAPLVGGGNSVDVYVCRLRSKLEKPLGIRLIHTVRGQGYRLR